MFDAPDVSAFGELFFAAQEAMANHDFAVATFLLEKVVAMAPSLGFSPEAITGFAAMVDQARDPSIPVNKVKRPLN